MPVRSLKPFLAFAALLAMVLSMQWLSGAWQADLGDDPDEAAHAVTSLMVRDYLAHEAGSHPLRFAEKYYETFPKVALGHYPPGYYLLAGLWLLPQPTLGSLLVFQSVIAALLGTLGWSMGKRMMPSALAFGVSAFAVLLPAMEKVTAQIMADLLLALLCLLAAEIWRRYLDRPKAWTAFWFGSIAAFAILTKGSALSLALLPPMAWIFSGKLRQIWPPRWWPAPIPVLLFAAPWMAWSVKFTQEGMIHEPISQFLPEAVSYYAAAFPHVIGWLMAAVLLGAFVYGVVTCVRGQWLGSTESVLWAIIGGTLVLIVLVPAGLTTRYLIPALVPIALLFGQIIHQASSRFAPQKRLRQALPWAVLIVAGAEVLRPIKKEVSGFETAVSDVIAANGHAPSERWLVCSDARGEGALVAAAAFATEDRTASPRQILRATKELSSVDWLGRDYQGKFADVPSLLKGLDDMKVSWVLIDETVPEASRMPHQKLLLDSVRSSPTTWGRYLLVAAEGMGRQRGEVWIYRRIPSA